MLMLIEEDGVQVLIYVASEMHNGIVTMGFETVCVLLPDGTMAHFTDDDEDDCEAVLC